MPSPFPGMDPYLEGYLWGDAHQRLAGQLSKQLTPLIKPNYVARLVGSVAEDRNILPNVNVMYPDIEVFQRKPPKTGNGHGALVLSPVAVAVAEIMPAPVTIPRLFVKIISVEIYDVAQNKLITAIEILSPINKREPYLSQYRDKCDRLMQAEVNLLEIDLLRYGKRLQQNVPETPYLITLTRVGAGYVEAWPLELTDKLPVLPVPLFPPHADVPLDMALALATIYDEAAYDLSIDYRQAPPPPPLAEDNLTWLDQRLQEAGYR